jgi:hypothetical protein
MEDLERYLDEIAEPTIKDFEDNPTSVRHAFLACVAVFHGIDYLAYPRKRPSTLRQQFRSKSPAFKIVDDVAHAFKHVIAGNPEKPNLKADDVISRPPAFYNKSGAWGLSRWGDPIGGVTLDGDRRVDLLEVVKAARDFLRTKTKPQLQGGGTQSTTHPATLTEE